MNSPTVVVFIPAITVSTKPISVVKEAHTTPKNYNPLHFHPHPQIAKHTQVTNCVPSPFLHRQYYRKRIYIISTKQLLHPLFPIASPLRVSLNKCMSSRLDRTSD